MKKTRIANCVTCQRVATLYVKKNGSTGECRHCRKGVTYEAIRKQQLLPQGSHDSNEA